MLLVGIRVSSVWKSYRITNNKPWNNSLSSHFSRSLIKSLSPRKSAIFKLATELKAEACSAGDRRSPWPPCCTPQHSEAAALPSHPAQPIRVNGAAPTCTGQKGKPGIQEEYSLDSSKLWSLNIFIFPTIYSQFYKSVIKVQLRTINFINLFWKLPPSFSV